MSCLDFFWTSQERLKNARRRSDRQTTDGSLFNRARVYHQLCTKQAYLPPYHSRKDKDRRRRRIFLAWDRVPWCKRNGTNRVGLKIIFKQKNAQNIFFSRPWGVQTFRLCTCKAEISQRRKWHLFLLSQTVPSRSTPVHPFFFAHKKLSFLSQPSSRQWRRYLCEATFLDMPPDTRSKAFFAIRPAEETMPKRFLRTITPPLPCVLYCGFMISEIRTENKGYKQGQRTQWNESRQGKDREG